MSPEQRAVLRNRDFRRFWTAITVARAGAHVTVLALPLTAVTLLGADAVQLGLLTTVQLLPMLVVTPLAGVITDVYPARVVNSVCDLVRGVLLLGVPLLTAVGALGMGWLYVLSAFVGILKALADIAHHSMLPRLVPPGQVVAGNAAVNASYSVTDVAGPGLGGLLVQAVTAPYAIVLDAVGFLVSGGLIASLKTEESGHRAVRERWSVMVGDGFRFLVRSRPLLMLGISGGVANVFIQAYLTIFVLYAVDTLEFSPVKIGALYALGALGGVVGAASAGRLGERFSRVGAMAGGNVTVGAGMVLIATAGAVDGGLARPVCATAGIWLYSMGLGVYNVHSMSARQQLCPPDKLGRITAGYRLLSHGSLPLGALAGGYCARWAGQTTTIALAGAGLILWMGIALATPFRRLDEQKTDDAAVTAA